jgi:rod shape-determining protein MreC
MNIRIRLGLLLLCASCIFFVTRMISPLYSRQTLDTISSMVVYPFLKIQSYIVEPLRILAQKKWHIQELQLQVDALHEEKEKLAARLVQMESALRFVHDTKPLYEYMDRYTLRDAKIAHVIMCHLSEHEHYILVDAGTLKGIQPGMVALYENNLVGRVDSVTPFYSKIILVTDRSCKVAVWCGTSQARGIHEGMNKLDLSELTHINHLQQVAKDDLVLSSGEGIVFPQGFALGKVIHSSSDGIYQKVMVEPLIAFDELNYCVLVQKGTL